jgi:glutamate racemase
LVALAPWPVDWVDPAPAIARRVADLLGRGSGEAGRAGAEMVFTSGRRHAAIETLVPFFGGRIPA